MSSRLAVLSGDPIRQVLDNGQICLAYAIDKGGQLGYYCSGLRLLSDVCEDLKMWFLRHAVWALRFWLPPLCPRRRMKSRRTSWLRSSRQRGHYLDKDEGGRSAGFGHTAVTTLVAVYISGVTYPSSSKAWLCLGILLFAK